MHLSGLLFSTHIPNHIPCRAVLCCAMLCCVVLRYPHTCRGTCTSRDGPGRAPPCTRPDAWSWGLRPAHRSALRLLLWLHLLQQSSRTTLWHRSVHHQLTAALPHDTQETAPDLSLLSTQVLQQLECEHANMAHCNLGAGAAPALGAALSANRSISSLDLRDNNLDGRVSSSSVRGCVGGAVSCWVGWCRAEARHGLCGSYY